MTPWWLIMLGGLLGSSHCIGMCGGFAAIVGLHTGSLLGNLRAQLIYSIGRLMSYVTLGALAGFAGKQLITELPSLINVPAILCLAAGVFLVREGLLASGLVRRRIEVSSSMGCLIMAPLFSTVLKTPGMQKNLVAGVLTGLLPCGLVYAFVSLAASRGDLLEGMTLMLAFGAGTIPLMVITGCGASLLSWSARKRLWQFAAWSVMITGVLTVARGLAFFQAGPEEKAAACPFCTRRPADVSPAPHLITPSDSWPKVP